ncbi:MAG: hypothetical protein QM703_22165 [Gemmatales bacterium]
MKLLTLSPVSRQLIIFGLIVALLWYGSRPVIGPDGRIVCCSADYQAINFLNYLQRTDAFPSTVDVVEIAWAPQNSLVLKDLPVTHKYWSEPSKFWQTAIEYIPALNQIPRIRSKAQGGWMFYFSVTPEQWEQINMLREGGQGMLSFQ